MDNFVDVCGVGDLPERDPLGVDAHGYRLALFLTDGEVHALGARCPHAGGPLDDGYVKDDVVVCPWHSSMFRISTGERLDGPCTTSVPVFPVRIEGDRVLVGPPPEGIDPPPPSFLSL